MQTKPPKRSLEPPARLPSRSMADLNRLSTFPILSSHLDRQLEHVEQTENPFAALVTDQSIVIVPEFERESGVVLRQVPVAYKTWGKLNVDRSNVLIICHALSGSADVEDWFFSPFLGCVTHRVGGVR